MLQITEQQFDEQYTIKENHITGNESFGGLYETYGEELEYIFQLSQKANRVWTIIEGDNGELFYVSGFHRVNRLGFLVTEEEHVEGTEVELED